MVRILVIGDPHIKPKEIEATDAMISDIINIAKDIKPDAIVVLGDTLHNHERIHCNPLSRSVDFLGLLSDIATLYLLIGNHDLRNNQVFLETENPFTALKRWKNTVVIDVSKTFEISGLKFAAVPYVPPGRFEEALGSINLEELTAIFAHQEFRCAKIGSDCSTIGDLWPKHRPLCISGHIHEAHQPATNVIYVGTPMQQNFGESEDKAIALFTWQDKSNPKYERLRLPSVPIRREYKINASDFEALNGIFKDVKDGTFLIKIIISGSIDELKICMMTSVIKQLKKMSGIMIISNPIDSAGETKAYIEPSKKTFDEIVRKSISNDEAVFSMYQKLFSK